MCILCPCDHYQWLDERRLIIKLDAMGEVLHATALLPPLAETHPRSFISWITRGEARLLVGGKSVHCGDY